MSEIEHFRSHLHQALSVRLRTFLKQWSARTVEHNRKLLFRRGGAEVVGEHEAKKFVDAFYEVTFGPRDSDIPFSNPYLASFCSHESDHRYERDNGLLSQWRGYGAKGGYAIVFDTEKLHELLREEGKRYDYTTLKLATVVYNEGVERLGPIFADLLDRLTKEYGAHLEFGKEADVDIYNPLVSAATRFKHRGFIEEREVRIIAAPMTEQLRRKVTSSDEYDKSTAFKPLKPFNFRGPSSTVPFIELFDSDGVSKLPIVRIIVGPSRDQKDRQRMVRKFLESTSFYKRIPVYRSETPYIESRN